MDDGAFPLLSLPDQILVHIFTQLLYYDRTGQLVYEVDDASFEADKATEIRKLRAVCRRFKRLPLVPVDLRYSVSLSSALSLASAKLDPVVVWLQRHRDLVWHLSLSIDRNGTKGAHRVLSTLAGSAGLYSVELTFTTAFEHLWLPPALPGMLQVRTLSCLTALRNILMELEQCKTVCKAVISYPTNLTKLGSTLQQWWPTWYEEFFNALSGLPRLQYLSWQGASPEAHAKNIASACPGLSHLQDFNLTRGIDNLAPLTNLCVLTVGDSAYFDLSELTNLAVMSSLTRLDLIRLPLPELELPLLCLRALKLTRCQVGTVINPHSLAMIQRLELRGCESLGLDSYKERACFPFDQLLPSLTNLTSLVIDEDWCPRHGRIPASVLGLLALRELCCLQMDITCLPSAPMQLPQLTRLEIVQSCPFPFMLHLSRLTQLQALQSLTLKVHGALETDESLLSLQDTLPNMQKGFAMIQRVVQYGTGEKYMLRNARMMKIE